MALFCLLLFATLGLSGASDGKELVKRLGRRFADIKDFKEFASGSKKTSALQVVLFYSTATCQACSGYGDQFEELHDRFGKMVRFFRYDCDRVSKIENFDGVTQCKKSYPDKFPQFYMFLPDEGTYYPYTPQTFSKTAARLERVSSIEQVSILIEENIPTFAKKIHNIDEMNEFMTHLDAVNRTLYFSNTEEPPTYFKGLSGVFKDFIEFGFVTPAAFEVQSYFNVTKLPRWVVLKKEASIKYEPRRYTGRRGFNELYAYLSVFKPDVRADRANVDLALPLEQRMNHLQTGLIKEDADYQDLRGSVDYPEEIVILHVRDILSMDYPNLLSFQRIYSELVKVVEFKADTVQKKRVAMKMFPEVNDRPFLVVYPFGSFKEKRKNRRVFDSWSSFDLLAEHVSELIGDHTEGTSPLGLETDTQKAFLQKKGVLLLLHDQEAISMAYRKLSRSKKYSLAFSFLTMKGPPRDFLDNIGVDELPCLVFIHPKLEDFFNDGSEALEVVPYGGKFLYSEIVQFLDAMDSAHVKYLRDIREIRGQEDFDQVCREKCILFVVDVKREKENEEWGDREGDMKVIRKNAPEGWEVAFVDIGCFSYLSGPLRAGGKDYPMLLAYREGRFTRSKFKLNTITGKQFVDSANVEENFRYFQPIKINLFMNECRAEEDRLREGETDL